MTLPASGPISMSQVNTELGLAATTTISLNQANVRALAGVPSGAISMSNLYGKSNITLAFNSGANFYLYYSAYTGYGGVPTVELGFTTDGGIYYTIYGAVPISSSSSGPTGYFSPITAGGGSNFELQMYVSSWTSTYYPYNYQFLVNGTTAYYRNNAPFTTAWSTGFLYLNFNTSNYDASYQAINGTVTIRNKATLASISRGVTMILDLYLD